MDGRPVPNRSYWLSPSDLVDSLYALFRFMSTILSLQPPGLRADDHVGVPSGWGEEVGSQLKHLVRTSGAPVNLRSAPSKKFTPISLPISSASHRTSTCWNGCCGALAHTLGVPGSGVWGPVQCHLNACTVATLSLVLCLSIAPASVLLDCLPPDYLPP